MATPEPIACNFERHAGQILDIFNEAIVNSTALYDYQPRTMESMKKWFEAKRAGAFPVIGFEDTDGRLMGFASFGKFRDYPAYKYTVEHSVYVRSDLRGKGLGSALLDGIVAEAERWGAHAVIGAIDADNTASIALHESHGFAEVGRLPQVGFKFGRWLNLVFYQRTLASPANPIDG
jgi:L-amino acid N-acyltransferase YncA